MKRERPEQTSGFQILYYESSTPDHPFATTNKDEELNPSLLNPHYSNGTFREPQTIFIEKDAKTEDGFGAKFVVGADYNYSDRLSQFYENYFDVYREVAERVGNSNTARFFEELLRVVYTKPQIRLVHIMSGHNLSNGYPYQVFGTIDPIEQAG